MYNTPVNKKLLKCLFTQEFLQFIYPSDKCRLIFINKPQLLLTRQKQINQANATSRQQHNMQVAIAGVYAFPASDINETLKNVAHNSIDYDGGTTPVIKGLNSMKAMDEE